PTSTACCSSPGCAPTAPGAPSTRFGPSPPPRASRSCTPKNMTPARPRSRSTRRRSRRSPGSGLLRRATSSASWSSGPGSPPPFRPRSPGARRPAGAATAATATAAPTTTAPTTTAPLAWITLWDDPAEADDFARAARQVLAKLSNATSGAASGTPAPDDDGDQTVLASPRGAYALARRGDAVALLLGAPEPAPAALQAMLEAVRPRASRRAAPHPRRGAQPGCPRRDRAAGPP